MWYWEMSLTQSFVVKVCFLEYHCVVEKYLVSETITLFTKNKSFKEGRTKPTNHIAVQKKACVSTAVWLKVDISHVYKCCAVTNMSLSSCRLPEW